MKHVIKAVEGEQVGNAITEGMNMSKQRDPKSKINKEDISPEFEEFKEILKNQEKTIKKLQKRIKYLESLRKFKRARTDGKTGKPV
jgi:predicted RNase H-like nuclease (RuvC/YqgF family)